MKLVFEQTLEVGSKQLFQVLLPKNDLENYRNQTPLKITGKITRTDESNGHTAYGISFGDIDNQTQLKLRAAMHFLSGQKSTKHSRAA